MKPGDSIVVSFDDFCKLCTLINELARKVDDLGVAIRRPRRERHPAERRTPMKAAGRRR